MKENNLNISTSFISIFIYTVNTFENSRQLFLYNNYTQDKIIYIKIYLTLTGHTYAGIDL